MFINFQKDRKGEWNDGNEKLTALIKIKYKKIDHDCQTWLDVNTNILMSSNHLYYKTRA